MRAIRMALAGAGMGLVLLAGCATPPVTPGRAAPTSAQFLYRSSGFVGAETFSSIVLVATKTAAPEGGGYRIVATLRHNDMPDPGALVITADREEVALRDEHPRTIRDLTDSPSYTTRLSFDLDQRQVRKLRDARQIEFRYGYERAALTAPERRILQGFLAGSSPTR